MSTQDLFGRVIGALERAGIPYMLTGSFASSYHGTPRATQDFDVVIAPTPDQLLAFVKGLPKDEYYVDEGTALDAERQKKQFNVIDFATGWKIDLIIRKSRPFSYEEFARRVFVEFAGMQLAIASAEDVIIAKLEWGKLGASQRQIDDAAGVLRIRAREIDRTYIEKWVHELGLQVQWQEAIRIADTNA